MNRVVLRTLVPVAALWIVPIVVVIEIVNLNRPRLVWTHWVTTIDVLNGSYVLLAPLAAGVSCLAAIRVVERFEMVGALPDGGWRALSAPAIGTALTFSVVHLLALAVVVVSGLLRGTAGTPNPLPTLVVLAAFFAASAVGAAVAKLSPSLTSPPLVVLACYAFEIFEPRVGNRLFSDFGGVSVLLLGLRNDPGIVAWQTLWLVAAAVLLLAVAVWGLRASPRWWVGVMVWVVFLGGGVGLANQHASRFEEASVQWSCAGADPQVCVASEFEDELAYFEPRVAGYARGLEDLGLSGVPDSFRQIVGADRPDGGFFGLDRAGEQLAVKVLESSLPCSANWTEADLPDVDAVVAYLVDGEGAQLYPQQEPATRGSARSAVAQLSC